MIPREGARIVNQNRWRGILCALLCIAFFFGVAGWLERLQSDLTWDEAHSYNAYARHPVTAVGLYLEPNNHPLESLYRSIFYGVLGITGLEFNRLPGLGVLVAYLLVLSALLRGLARREQWPGVVVLGLGLLLADATQVQVLRLRGYFPSMVLLLTYFLLLFRRTPILEAGTVASGRKPLRAFALLSGLLVFTVPSNMIFLPALWVGTVLAFPHPSSRGRLRALLGLGGGSALIALLFYLPIVVGALLGINRMDQFPQAPHPGFWPGVLSGTGELIRLSTPVGISVPLFGAGAAAVVLVALLRTLNRPETRTALAMLATLVLGNAVFSGLLTAPDRIKSPMIVIVWVCLCLLAVAITEGFNPGQRLRVALVLAATGLLLLPAQARQVKPDRTASGIVSFLDVYCRPDESFVLVAADTGNLWFYLSHRFGEDRLIRGRPHIDETFRGIYEPTVPENAKWKQRLRRFFFPELEQPPVAPEDVEILVLITEQDYHPGGTVWDHPILDRIGDRLSRVETFYMGPHRIEIKTPVEFQPGG